MDLKRHYEKRQQEHHGRGQQWGGPQEEVGGQAGDEEVTPPLASAPRQREVNITIFPRIVILMSLPGSLPAL